jgi:hypothetical protein
MSRGAQNPPVAAPPRDNQPPAPQNQTDKNITTVCVLGQLKAEGEEVSIGAIFGEDTTVLLEKPTKLGNALTIGAWLNNSWGTKVDALLVKEAGNDGKVHQSDVKAADVKKHLDVKGYPAEVTEFLSKLFVADVYITDLYLRRWKEKPDGKELTKTAFKFGMAVDFKEGLPLIGEITLEKAAIGIVNSPKDYDFSKAPTLPALPQFKVPDVEKVKEEVEAAAAEEAEEAETEKPKSEETPAPTRQPPPAA